MSERILLCCAVVEVFGTRAGSYRGSEGTNYSDLTHKLHP